MSAEARDALVSTVKDFIRDLNRNKWICSHAFKVYVRRDINKTKFWIGSVEVYKSGQGTFKKVILPACERAAKESGFAEIVVENVGSPRFANFFRKLEWREVTYGGTPTFYKSLQE